MRDKPLMPSRARERELRRLRTDKRIADGVCVYCGTQQALSYSRYCQQCRQRSYTRYHNRKAVGCHLCGNETTGGKANCDKCLAAIRDKRNARIAAGFCRNCDNRIQPPNSQCAECRLKKSVRKKVRKAQMTTTYQPGKAAWLDD